MSFDSLLNKEEEEERLSLFINRVLRKVCRLFSLLMHVTCETRSSLVPCRPPGYKTAKVNKKKTNILNPRIYQQEAK